MTRRSYVQINGVLYERGTEPRSGGPAVQGPAILPDQPDFVSPIDGKRYSGRVGMRDHNARHDVVSNRDLVGLPTLQANSDFRSDRERREQRAHLKEQVIRSVDQQYRKYNG